jgi:putative transposase
MSSADPKGIGRLMQSIGRRYVRYFNDRHARTGTLWEGRYRATVIDSEQYLFACSRYIEENPLRAGMVRELSHYRWSSYAFNALGREDPLIIPHDRYLALGSSPARRQLAYRRMFRAPNDDTTLQAIRYATNHAWALGSEQFQREISGKGRRAAPLPPGPPPSPVRSLTPNWRFGV